MSLNPKILYPKYLQRVRSGKRIPIMKIQPAQYSTLEEIKLVFKAYEKKLITHRNEKRKTLIIGHGRIHPVHLNLPVNQSILLDLNPVSIPDIIGDMKNTTLMNRLPKNYFDEIILMYTPPPSPISDRNKNIWPNCQRILKPGGVIKSRYIMHVFMKKNINLEKAKQAIQKYFVKSKLFKKVIVDKAWVYLIK